MIINLCPACRCVNAVEAQRCEACGFDLTEGDTEAAPLRGPGDGPHPGAIWLDDLAPPGRPPRAVGEPETPAPPLTLRDLPPPQAVEPRPPEPSAPEELVASDPPAPPVDATAATGDENKTARRAAVRRARLRGAVAPGVAAPALTRMLVLDADAGTRAQLGSLLRNFGFEVYPVPDATRAAALVASRPFAAVFVDIALDGTDGDAGVELCRQVRRASERRGGAATVLVLVASQLQPIDRVRAALAGCNEAILKPVTRGSVAGVLDTHGIALPLDARRA